MNDLQNERTQILAVRSRSKSNYQILILVVMFFAVAFHRFTDVDRR
ncbi:hypothetical protein Oscil6304_1199 [Oscillatoria acuminata PCC 6304]|uniref:Uncharacterized protein n=1 Tax=Oscillatoria acuminata PCC 6304 TaxID=56110 RepID=K9TEF7_9CYAN|nr:hypothetical protein Oscil6304_1199 [Oscillatoria acuminata PCC 6304]